MSDGYRCLCGGEGRLVTEPREITLGHWSVTVDDTFVRCLSCDERWYLPGQMAASQEKAAALIREKHHLMAPEAIRALRERMGLTQTALEQLLGVGPKTVTRWEKGSVVPSATANRLLALMESDPTTALKLCGTYGVSLSKFTRLHTHITYTVYGKVYGSKDLPEKTFSVDYKPSEKPLTYVVWTKVLNSREFSIPVPKLGRDVLPWTNESEELALA